MLMDEELNDSDISLDDSVHSGENDELVNLLDVPYTSTESREEDSLEYEILHPNQLSQLMSDITKEVEQIIQIAPTYLRLLLAHFKWDKDALIEFYFEHGKAYSYAQAGIIDPMDIPEIGSKNLCEKKLK
uniref:Ariadne n=1 Tax=Schistosoma japonicum TaxID=6182 RepID=C1L4B2_SCHJA|nr:ariadne [Schistosoma japonicum]